MGKQYGLLKGEEEMKRTNLSIIKKPAMVLVISILLATGMAIPAYADGFYDLGYHNEVGEIINMIPTATGLDEQANPKPNDDALGYGKRWDNFKAGVKKVAGNLHDAFLGTKEQAAAKKATLEANEKKTAEKSAAAKANAQMIQPWSAAGQIKNDYTISNGGYNIPTGAAAFNPAIADEYKKVLDSKGTIVSGNHEIYQPSNATPAAMQNDGKVTDEEPISLRDIGMDENTPKIPSIIDRAFAEKVCTVNVREDIIKFLNAMGDDAFLDLRDYMISGHLWGSSIIDTPYVQKLNQIVQSGKSKKLSSGHLFRDIADRFSPETRLYPGQTKSAGKIKSTKRLDAYGIEHGGGGVGFGHPVVKMYEKKVQKAKESALKAKAFSIRNATPVDIYTTGLSNQRTILVNAFLAKKDQANIEAFNKQNGLLSWSEKEPYIYYGLPFYSSANAEFSNNLTNAIPMLLAGNEYTVSAFGGDGSMQNPSALESGGAVALCGAGLSMFDLNAFSDPSEHSPVIMKHLSNLAGPYASALAMMPPAFLSNASNGINPLDIPSSKKTKMDKQNTSFQKKEDKNTILGRIRTGFNISADYFKKFTATGKEFVSSKITGEDYERQLDDKCNTLTGERLKTILK